MLALAGGVARADAPALAGLAPADDARLAVAIGPGGQLYEPDGKGAWTRTRALAVATPVTTVERGALGIVIGGGGAVYRLAANGWTAIRLAQKGKAIGGTGRRAIVALGREVFDLDRLAGSASGEPVKTTIAAAAVTAIGGEVIATDRGLARLDGSKLVAIDRTALPSGTASRPDRGPLGERATPVSARWAIGARGAVELRDGRTVAWPAGMTIAVADAAPDGSLVAVSTRGELVTVTGDRLVHAPIPIDGAISDASVPVGVVADRAGRVAVAFRDGRIALRDRGDWTVVTVEDRLPPAKPGSPPATSP